MDRKTTTVILIMGIIILGFIFINSNMQNKSNLTVTNQTNQTLKYIYSGGGGGSGSVAPTPSPGCTENLCSFNPDTTLKVSLSANNRYCINGTLIENCDVCGCAKDYYGNAATGCSAGKCVYQIYQGSLQGCISNCINKSIGESNGCGGVC